MKKYLFVLLLVSIISCQRAMYIYYGIKNPKIENISSIKHYLHKKVKTDNYKLLFFKNIEAMTSLSTDKKLSVPDAYFFNKKGEFVTYKKSPKECNAYVDSFIKDLKQMDNIKGNDSINLYKLQNFLVDENKKPISFSKNKRVLIMTFAKYLGKVNDKHTFDWFESINKLKSKNFEIEVYMLDSDFMDFWDIKKEDLPKIK